VGLSLLFFVPLFSSRVLMPHGASTVARMPQACRTHAARMNVWSNSRIACFHCKITTKRTCKSPDASTQVSRSGNGLPMAVFPPENGHLETPQITCCQQAVLAVSLLFSAILMQSRISSYGACCGRP